MKRMLFIAILVLVLPLLSWGVTADIQHPITKATSNITAGTSTVCQAGSTPPAGFSCAVNVTSHTTAVFQACCAFTATVNFLASVDGVNYDPIGCSPMTTHASYQTSTTSEGIFQCNIAGINKYLTASITNYASGTISVTVGLLSGGLS